MTFKAYTAPVEKESKEILLLKKCMTGDHKAQVQVYEAYSKAMYNTALRFVSDVFDAEDITQEAFITAFQKLSELENLALFAGWLKQIVVNKSINRLKQQTAFDEFKNSIEVNEVEEKVDFDPSTSISAVKEVLRNLPEGYKVILNLYLFEGYDHEEIGEILQISSATSRSQFNRGKKKLKELLTQSS